MFDFDGKVAVVTGGARGIGKVICQRMREAGATVALIDILDNDYFVGDLADKATLEKFAWKVIADYGRVDYLINNAAPKSVGITKGSYEDFEYAQRVGVTAPFYLTKLFMPYFSQIRLISWAFFCLMQVIISDLKSSFALILLKSALRIPK